MEIYNILGRFSNVEEATTGADKNVVREWSARCPVHDDRRNSLYIGQKTDGKIMIHCQAGCDNDRILTAAGLTYADLFTEKKAPKQEPAKREAEYLYNDEARGIHLKKIRLRNPDGSKAFFWQRLEAGEWKNGRAGIDPPLYGLQYLSGHDSVFVVEGEKDADSMNRLDFPCVSLPDGAKRGTIPWPSFYDDSFRGRSVYIIPDNDDVGRAFAELEAGNIQAVADQVFILDLREAWPEIPEKGDISDLIETLGDEAACRMIADLGKSAKPWKAEPERPAEDKQEWFSAVPAESFGEDKTDFVWKPYIPVGDYTVLMAPGGTGKTFLMCGVAAAVSKGADLPGDFRPREAGVVLIVSAEDRGELLKKRLAASGADLSKVLLIDCMASAGMDFSESFTRFRATILHYAPRLLIVDPWHAFLGEKPDLNRVNAIRPIFQRLANLAKEASCGMILISHVNKRSQGENINNAATGSTDFVNAARSALYVIFDEEDDDCRIAVHTKSNYDRYGDSVKFRIVNGGIRWEGISKIDRFTMEQAARQKKTPGEIINKAEESKKARKRLFKALIESASPVKDVRFTYEDFREKYGEDIFESPKPKINLDAVAGDMLARGYQLVTGIQVKKDGRKGNGFKIRPASDKEE